MSYLALYRKYRPSMFKDVIGQEAIVKTLKNSVKSGNINHAFLFSGPRGTGKTSVAKIFSRAINCVNPVDGDRCEKCEMCKAISENDMDIIEIDAASNNGVDEIREIRNNVKLVPTVGKYKIYIIDEVHMLSIGAFNALLKTLEEPPEHAIFILATTEIQKIPLTIISRCQRFDFKKVTPSVLSKLLKKIAAKENKEVSDDVIELISETSDGGVRDAINLLDQLLTNCLDNPTINDIYSLNGDVPEVTIEQLFVNVAEGNIPAVLNTINEFYNAGKNLNSIAERLLLLVKDININNNVKNYFKKEKREKLEKFKNLSNYETNIIIKRMLDMIGELKKTTNQKIIFEIMMLEIIENLKKEDKEENIIEEISENIREKSVEKIPERLEIISREIILIRINNTLAEANKECLANYREKMNILNEYLANKKYNKVANILMSGNLIVASNNHLMFEYKKDLEINLFYKNIKLIEKLLNEILKLKCKAVAVSQMEWNTTKKEYVQNKKNGIIYKLQEEPKIEEKIIHDDKAINIFGEESIDIK